MELRYSLLSGGMNKLTVRKCHKPPHIKQRMNSIPRRGTSICRLYKPNLAIYSKIQRFHIPNSQLKLPTPRGSATSETASSEASKAAAAASTTEATATEAATHRNPHGAGAAARVGLAVVVELR